MNGMVHILLLDCNSFYMYLCQVRSLAEMMRLYGPWCACTLFSIMPHYVLYCLQQADRIHDIRKYIFSPFSLVRPLIFMKQLDIRTPRQASVSRD